MTVPLHCRGWQQEGIYRLLQNVLAPDVAENPYEFVVYGNGRAVRDQPSLVQLLHALAELRDDETLLVQSGKPVGTVRTHTRAPRVVMAASMLVPHWSTWQAFHELERKNLTLYGQSTASSWAYIGAQGILQNTYETLWQVAREQFNGSLRGRLVLTSGLGGMGSAQPIAVEMNHGVAIVVEVDADKVHKRLETNHIQVATSQLDEAIHLATEAMNRGESLTIALLGNAADVYEAFVRRGITPDIVTDQTSAHDLWEGYIPAGLSLGEARELRLTNPDAYMVQARQSVRRHAEAMLTLHHRGAVVFEYGNHLRGQAADAGLVQAMEIPSFITLFRDLFCAGSGPLRWIALSGEQEDIYVIDEWMMEQFADDDRLVSWIHFVQERVHFQGLPARSAWLTYDQRAALVDKLAALVAGGVLRAPVAVTRDHMNGATMASPRRETEAMLDGSDAVADWPILNALLMAATGATLVSVQQGGGVGIGHSVHAGVTVVIDGSETNAHAARQSLLNEVELGIIRYADAGYPVAREKLARMHGTTGQDSGGR